MCSLRLRKTGSNDIVEVDENATGRELKEILGVPSDSVLTNARNQIIADNERIGNKVRDGEEVATRPNFKYW